MVLNQDRINKLSELRAAAKEGYRLGFLGRRSIWFSRKEIDAVSKEGGVVDGNQRFKRLARWDAPVASSPMRA